MKIITTRSSEMQDKVQVYGNAIHVYLMQREVTIGTSEEQEPSTQYEYSVVTLDKNYGGEPIALAEDFLRNSMVLTPRQAREIIILQGLDESIEAAIDAIVDVTERKVARNYWEYSEDFKRNNPLLVGLASGMGMTSQQLDDMFIAGKSV